MFDTITLWFRIAKVQAELKAQINDQDLVNHLCQLPQSLKLINFLSKKAYYRKRKDSAFLIVCALMLEIINDEEQQVEDRSVCCKILKERLDRMKGDEIYCAQNMWLVQECERTIQLWESIPKDLELVNGYENDGKLNIVSQLIFLQLPLCKLDPIELCKLASVDDHILGYIFGMADMAGFQLNNGDCFGSGNPLIFIKEVFVSTLGGGGEGNFYRAISCQDNHDFILGRKSGCNDFERWIKMQGTWNVIGLASYYLGE